MKKRNRWFTTSFFSRFFSLFVFNDFTTNIHTQTYTRPKSILKKLKKKIIIIIKIFKQNNVTPKCCKFTK